MRSLGLIGLVVALLIVGMLVQKQLHSVGVNGAPVAGVGAPDNVREQSHQIQQQVQQSLDAAARQTQERLENAEP